MTHLHGLLHNTMHSTIQTWSAIIAHTERGLSLCRYGDEFWCKSALDLVLDWYVVGQHLRLMIYIHYLLECPYILFHEADAKIGASPEADKCPSYI